MMNEIENKPKFILADSGTRFGHNMIHTIVFGFIIFLHAMILDGWLGLMSEEGSDWFPIYLLLLYVLFFTLFEYFFGKTPGKFLTKTKVVCNDGSKPKFLNLIVRNAARLIPLDPFSFLVSRRGLHDKISNTYVIIDRK